MNNTIPEPGLTKSVGTSTCVAGILLMIVGAAGVFLPSLLSLTVEIFLGWLMVIAGVLFGYYGYQSRSRTLIDWLKPLILIIAGVLLLVYPTSGIAALSLMLSFYLFVDAFAGFGLAYERHPLAGWGWMTVNGVLSFILAVLLLVGWPATSPIYLGIYVGVSLFFDGLALLMLGLGLRKAGNP